MKFIFLVLGLPLVTGLRLNSDCSPVMTAIKPPSGGFFPVNLANVSDKDRVKYNNITSKAVELMNQVKTGQPIQLVKLVSLEKQMIAGAKYALELQVNINGQVKTCFVYSTHSHPWYQGGTWSVAAQCPKDPCALFQVPDKH